MARFSTIMVVGMLIVITCQISAQTLDERLQQFSSSFMLFKRVTETKLTRLEAKNTQLEALLELKDQQHELLAEKVAQLELSLMNEQPALASNSKTATVHTEEVITVTNGEKDGRWGRLETCPTGSRATGYQTQNKFEALFEDVDETGMNMLIIFCDDLLKTKISSPAGFLGDWQPIRECPAGSYMKSFRMRVSPAGQTTETNTTDNTAINNIRFTCSNGRELRGEGNTGGTWGNYSAECVDGICGMETRFRPDGGLLVDNTALNDVRFTCCTPADLELHHE
ncbi:hypothetical protein GHT06_010852 [Daphnia sinensis]|uniref:Uncharacterized protein n=1 Tax=Daphnia sinensis TaxID=1820382 RepID=A0AAD5KE68_9CRUS|nr:hypothetical protein GHT06_004538 [Daphnia sinensis]KAI9563389.1 hypothetical protein GHT06_010852 [Daphnia sinensis]